VPADLFILNQLSPLLRLEVAMKALAVDYDATSEHISPQDVEKSEDWEAVCERFEGDVHRVRAASDVADYDALYVCYDEDNRPSYFLVSEDAELQRARHRVFLKKLGR
jgi:hypothetical protein